MDYSELISNLKDTSGILIDDNDIENAIFVFKESSDNCYSYYEDEKNSFIFTRGLFLEKDALATKTKLLKAVIDSIDKKSGKPIIIKIPQTKLMEDISVEQKQTFNDNLKTVFSFLNNSSIWVRVVDEVDPVAKDEFNAFAEMKLYEYGSAKENFDFNCRIQSENWLEGDHGHDVTPILYGNESEFYEILFG